MSTDPVSRTAASIRQRLRKLTVSG